MIKIFNIFTHVYNNKLSCIPVKRFVTHFTSEEST